jgi:hypothetical protein
MRLYSCLSGTIEFLAEPIFRPPGEIEASRVSRECLGRRRIGHFHTLKFEVAAWRERADREARPIRWAFTVRMPVASSATTESLPAGQSTSSIPAPIS